MQRCQHGILRDPAGGVNSKPANQGEWLAMGKRRRRWLVAFFAVVAVGCSDQDTERLARVGQKVAGKVHGMAGGADTKLAIGLQAMRANWSDASLENRVSARLRWEKLLDGASIQVHAAGNTVELKGIVSDLGQRRRAIDLAQSTTGVEKVVDVLGEAGQ